MGKVVTWSLHDSASELSHRWIVNKVTQSLPNTDGFVLRSPPENIANAGYKSK